MYRKVNNSRFMVIGISGIVLVMSIFTWLIYGIANNIATMTHNVSIMAGSTANMNANVARLSYDVARSSHLMSSPMDYFWNMGR